MKRNLKLYAVASLSVHVDESGDFLLKSHLIGAPNRKVARARAIETIGPRYKNHQFSIAVAPAGSIRLWFAKEDRK